MCTVVGAHGLEDPWSSFEIGAALAGHKLIIPVLTDRATPADLPPFLREVQAVNASSPAAAASLVANLVASAHDGR